MSNTLAQYATLTVDALKKGIANTIVTEDPLLRGEKALPFQSIAGNSIKYNMQTVATPISFYNVGDTIAEGTPTWSSRNADLAILLAQADVDNFAKSTGMIDEAVILSIVAKDLAAAWAMNAVLGQTTTNTAYNVSKNFKGLLRILAECESSTTTDLDSLNNAQVITPGASASTVITLDYLDQLVDTVRSGKATHILTSKLMRRKINSLARAAGNNLQHDKDALGFPVTRYGDQQLIVSEAVPDNMDDPSSNVTAIASYVTTTTRAATDDITPIFAFRVGDDGLVGLTSRENGMIQTDPAFRPDNKDCMRTPIKFYCGLALYNKLALAALIGMSTDA